MQKISAAKIIALIQKSNISKLTVKLNFEFTFKTRFELDSISLNKELDSSRVFRVLKLKNELVKNSKMTLLPKVSI